MLVAIGSTQGYYTLLHFIKHTNLPKFNKFLDPSMWFVQVISQKVFVLLKMV